MRSKLFTAAVDKQLANQYKFGNDLSRQKVVAKIFNPYGEGRWYLLNSDPDDPDYLWAIVSMFGNVEVGSVSRSELENLRLTPYRLPLERDRYFDPINAKEVFEGLNAGRFYAKGGEMAEGGDVDFMAGGGAIKQNEGKLFNEKGEMLLYKKQSETSSIYDVDVYEPRKTDVGEYSKFKYCKREKNGRECVYRLDKNALLEMIKKEKFIYAKGGKIKITGYGSEIEKSIALRSKIKASKTNLTNAEKYKKDIKDSNDAALLQYAEKKIEQSKKEHNEALKLWKDEYGSDYQFAAGGEITSKEWYSLLKDKDPYTKPRYLLEFTDSEKTQIEKVITTIESNKPYTFDNGTASMVIDIHGVRTTWWVYKYDDYILVKHYYNSRTEDEYWKLDNFQDFIEFLKEKKIYASKQKYAKGGVAGYERLVKKVAKNYEGKNVPRKYQSEYGKTYNKEEAKEVGYKVATKVYGKPLARMSNGGKLNISEKNRFINFQNEIPNEWQLVEWSFNGHSPYFKGKYYFQKGTGFLFIEKENGEIYEPKSSNKLFWREIM